MCNCHSRKKKVQVLSSWYGIKKRRIYFNNFTIGSVGHSVTCLKNKHSTFIGNDVLVRHPTFILNLKNFSRFHRNVSRAVRGELTTVYHNLYAKLKLVCVSLLNTFQIYCMLNQLNGIDQCMPLVQVAVMVVFVLIKNEWISLIWRRTFKYNFWKLLY